MDGSGFDSLTRSLLSARSRRGLGRLLGGVALGGLLNALNAPKAEATHFECRHVGVSCTRSSQCCSSRCRGPEGSKTCRAHHTGGCSRKQDICQTNNREASKCPNIPNGVCFITIGNAAFCSSNEGGGCERCRSDRDCVEKFGFPPGSACVFMHAGPTQCDLTCGALNDGRANDTVCMPPAVLPPAD